MAIDPDPNSARAGGHAFLSLVRDLSRFAGRRGVLALTYIALGAIFESFGLLLIVPLVALVIGNEGGHGRFQTIAAEAFAATGAQTPAARLALLLGGFAAVMVLRAVVITLRDVAVSNIQVGYVEHMRRTIADALATAGWDQVLRLRHARVLSVMGSDIQRISQSAHFLLQSGIAVTILVAQCALALALSPLLALFAIALLAFGAIAMVPVLRRNRELGRFVSVANISLVDTTTQFLSGLKFAISQDLQQSFVGEFHETIDGLTQRQLRFFRRQTAGRVILTTLTSLVGMAVVFVGYAFLGLSAPLLIAFLLVVGRMSGPATQIQQGVQQLALSLPSHEAISALLEELRRPDAGPSRAPRQTLEGPLVLEGVSYQHATAEADSHGVRSVSLTVLPGTVLGVAGPSGAGKTTLADLMVGLLKPQAGRIAIGGVTLDDSTLPSWRAQLSYISQDPFLFHDTIRRNLRWANPGASEAELWDVLAVAGADTIVRRMEGGLDAVVGERGSLVSGGERQRIAVARALLRKPRLLVMDEATNAIDVPGERQLIERILAMHARMTVVIIAHRAESLAACDRVVRMEDGRLYDGGARRVAAGT